jgi:aminoglycoside phosphotransferase (APT) family kinase protein
MTESQSAVDSTGIVAPNVRDLGTLERTLHNWLQAKMPQAKDLHLANFAYPRGAGLSHETILFDAQWTENSREQSEGMVIRIKPSSHTVYQDDMFEEQFRIMEAVHRQGRVPIAAPLWFEDDNSLVGAPFFVMKKKTGNVPVSFPPYAREGWLMDLSSDERHKIWRNGVTALGNIQRLPLAEVGFLDPANSFPDGFEQEWDRWHRYAEWAKAGRSYPFLDKVWSLLSESRPKTRQPGVVWGDARIGNMMFGKDCSVVAVMDWEQTSLGGALHDLAWWTFLGRLETSSQGLPTPAGFGTREDTIALWQEVTGIDASEIEWYERFVGFKTACLAVRTLELRDMNRPGMSPTDNPSTRALTEMFGIAGPGPDELS